MRARAFLVAAAVFVAPLGAEMSAAPHESAPFACAAGTAGQISVQGHVQCACRLFPESEMRGTPAGYRWDCGILRARTNHEVPESAAPYPYPLPEALSLDGSFILEEPGRGLRHHR